MKAAALLTRYFSRKSGAPEVNSALLFILTVINMPSVPRLLREAVTFGERAIGSQTKSRKQISGSCRVLFSRAFFW